MNYKFPPQARLLRENDFRQVYRHGEKYHSHPLYIRAWKRPENRLEEGPPGRGSRLGLSIGRKVGPAHVRNQWKRYIREAFRLNRHRLPDAYDLIIGVSWDATPDGMKEVEEAFERFIQKLRQENTESRS